ncbi:ELAV 2-like protein isoform X2 [Aplysia californica]|uniref:ELAV 2-like protein isoform X2 n=1 Tax=Aplysia californica TaxID=6500 RepID=A0ABM0ZZ60_APLCA|nr:ELAV 2-like protein isoform X2 [Aplysia californica]XP_012937529.1 ELAV 2-like protein isoform X2 [Aplysia californica]
MENQNDDSSSTNLIINYLPQTLTDEEFRSMFLSVGPVKSSKIVRDKSTGYSYGFGFVDFQHPTDAQRAIETLSGLQLQNKRIKVALARPGGDQIKGANLYIRNLPVAWKETELNKIFEPYGKIIQSRVLVDLSTGISKRVGFVLYDTRDEAENAIKCLSGKVPEGATEAIMIKFADDNSKKLKQQGPVQYVPIPNFAAPGPMRNQMNRFQRFNPMAGNFNGQGPGMPQAQQGGYTLFVYNIGFNATDRTLWQLFSPFGTVQKVNIMLDHEKNQCKGYGFVTMTNYQEAQNAINCLNGYFFQGRVLQVSFKGQNQAAAN